MQLSETPHRILHFHLAQHNKTKTTTTTTERRRRTHYKVRSSVQKWEEREQWLGGETNKKKAFERRFELLLCWKRGGSRCFGVPEETVKEEEGEQLSGA